MYVLYMHMYVLCICIQVVCSVVISRYLPEHPLLIVSFFLLKQYAWQKCFVDYGNTEDDCREVVCHEIDLCWKYVEESA